MQLSISLQSKQLNLSSALFDTVVFTSALKELQEDTDKYLKRIFKNISELTNLTNVLRPRICSMW